MTTTTAHKRLDEIETYLTPKEWAIRLADYGREYPSALACAQAMAKLALDELPTRRPYFAFQEQAGERHPGNKLEDLRARRRLADALWKDYHTLKLLIWDVNQAMQRKVQSTALQAALRLSALHALILQDAFAQTESPPGPVPPRDARRRYPAPLAEWSHEVTALLKDFFAHRAAVAWVQDRHFGGHPILFLDWEAGLTETARTIECAVATANDYLKLRAEPREAELNGSECGSILTIALESIKATAAGQRAAAIAARWLHDTRFEAIESDAEQWERWREEHGEDG
jgi:hypothetical protein